MSRSATTSVWLALLGLGCATVRTVPSSNPQADGDVTEAHWRGMTILVKRIPHEVIVAGQLYLRGGVRNWSKENAGVEKLALTTAVSGGTDSLDKEAFQNRLSALGSQLAAESGNDYSLFVTKALTRNWQPTFDLMARAFVEPALPPSEVELQRQLMLSELRQEEQEPDALLWRVAHEMFFAGLPYANRAIGTPESVAGLTRAQLVEHLQKLRETSRMLLVVVGDVEPDAVLAWAQAAFAKVPEGSYRETPLEVPRFSKPRSQIVERALPTNYIAQLFPAPSWNDPGMAVGVVAMYALREKLFEEVRTKRQLSYAPASGLQLRGIGLGFLYVTAVDPDQTLRVMVEVVTNYQKGDIDPVVLQGDKLIFLTHLLMQNESTTGQADLMARAELLGGDWRLSRDLPKSIQRVNKAQVAEFLKERMKNLQTVVIGKAKDVDEKLLEKL
jgi:zinc protease